MGSEMRVKIDEKALAREVGSAPGTRELLQAAVDKIRTRANEMSSGNRTGRWHDPATGKGKGPSEPHYDGDVRKVGGSYHGLVYTATYAAIKDNHENNTLLKARR